MTTPNADITLYHKEYDAEKRDYTYTPNQFPGVFWYGGQGVTLSSGGLKGVGRIRRAHPHGCRDQRRCG